MEAKYIITEHELRLIIRQAWVQGNSDCLERQLNQTDFTEQQQKSIALLTNSNIDFLPVLNHADQTND